MEFTPDDNDIVFNTYSFDFLGMFQALSNWGQGVDGGSLLDTIALLWNIYAILAILFSLLLLFGYIYAKIRVEQLVSFEDAQLANAEEAWAHTFGGASKENNAWADILKHVASDNPNDWRVAIIEADVLLDQVLEKAGYRGVSIADRLKDAGSSHSFSTVDDAWSAHKVRNLIAHAGGDFVLTKKIAQETITQYERVFTEFGTV